MLLFCYLKCLHKTNGFYVYHDPVGQEIFIILFQFYFKGRVQKLHLLFSSASRKQIKTLDSLRKRCNKWLRLVIIISTEVDYGQLNHLFALNFKFILSSP